MGYMSEVVFAVEADAVPTMLAWCEKHPALKQLLFVETDTRHLGDYDDAGSYSFTGAGSSGQKVTPALKSL